LVLKLLTKACGRFEALTRVQRTCEVAQADFHSWQLDTELQWNLRTSHISLQPPRT